jgi:hypothetical protein
MAFRFFGRAFFSDLVSVAHWDRDSANFAFPMSNALLILRKSSRIVKVANSLLTPYNCCFNFNKFRELFGVLMNNRDMISSNWGVDWTRITGFGPLETEVLGSPVIQWL